MYCDFILFSLPLNNIYKDQRSENIFISKYVNLPNSGITQNGLCLDYLYVFNPSKLAYLNGVTGFSEGDNNGFLGLFLDEPNAPLLGLDGLYITENIIITLRKN